MTDKFMFALFVDRVGYEHVVGVVCVVGITGVDGVVGFCRVADRLERLPETSVLPVPLEAIPC
jgi:hypothetical protein